MNKCQHPHSPFQCWKIVKCKLALDQSVLSTLHRGGEGQNAYKMKFPTLVTKVVAARIPDGDLITNFGFLTIQSPMCRLVKRKIREPKSEIQNPESRIRNPESGIRNLGIWNPESRIRNSGSGIRKTKRRRKCAIVSRNYFNILGDKNIWW